MISSDIIRGYNDTMILCLLLEGDSYAYAISKQVRNLSGGKYIMKETTLYSAFARLEKNGFITAYAADADGKSEGNAGGGASSEKRRTYYRITPAGLAYYKDKCREWKLTQEVVSQFIKEI